MKNRKNKILSLFLILVLTFSIACKKSVKAEKKRENIVKVKVANPKTGNIVEYVDFVGEVKPFKTYYVCAEVSEKVIKINVKNGQKVKKGDVLFELYDKRLKAKMLKNKASYESAKSGFEIAEKDYKRNELLYKNKVINDKTFDNVKNAYLNAKNVLEMKKNDYEISKINYENTRITSPIDGIFVNRNCELNQFVNTGYVLGKVINDEKVDVYSKINGIYVKNLKGKKAYCKNTEGTVFSVDKMADKSGNFLVKIRFDNTSGVFKCGDFVEGKIEYKTFENVPVVDFSSIVFKRNTPFIFVVKNSKANMRKIVIKAKNGDKVYAENVALNDLVVVDGQNVLKDSDKVEILK